MNWRISADWSNAMKRTIYSRRLSWLGISFCLAIAQVAGAEAFVRANQLGYQPRDRKLAIAFSEAPLPPEFEVVEAEGSGKVYTGKPRTVREATWGRYPHHADLDFSALTKPGRYLVKLADGKSLPFTIGPVFRELPDQLLEFMRQQRCGYNPWLDAVCHPFDGRTAYGPLTNGTYLNASGGWHDAADLLKYMITSGNATAQMLLAWQLGAERGVPFADRCNRLGQAGGNGIPDVLDEARWGLDWMLKLHPAPDQLYHQVADDRDHAGRRLPQNEIVDYGWGKGGARVVYCADGKPQGLMQYQSKATGIGNLAGRYAAAMGLAYGIWSKDPQHAGFARQCLQAGREVFDMGLAQEGYQQGNSYKAPYRYEESTWADDMEWGAAELYRVTREKRYLEHAKRYARMAGSESWMGLEQAPHYHYYPFMNMGHFRLYDLADRQTRKLLAGYYREGIERCLETGRRNPYRVGVPFIWCSNNLVTALATQCLLYEMMTGDKSYRDFATHQRDWLLGRNPWGYTMFTGVGTVFPADPHLMTVQITKNPVRGGLVDGPVYEQIFKSLKGVSITEPDPLGQFQGVAVFHDDVKDYSTDEPTMDGTASAILLWALSPVF